MSYFVGAILATAFFNIFYFLQTKDFNYIMIILGFGIGILIGILIFSLLYNYLESKSKQEDTK